MRISNNNTVNFKGDKLSSLAKPLSVFYNKKSIIPTLLIETGVTLGRTYQANKKGGKKEAIERFVEQGASAALWLWGVQGLNKIINATGEMFKKGISAQNGSKNFKAASMLTSLAAVTGFIGFVLPKINHYISKKFTSNSNKKENVKHDSAIKIKSFDEFQKKNNKNISFTSLTAIAKTVENNAPLRLFLTDTGVIAGRYKNGRNKYEKIEGLFRDISSIYFYFRATKDFVNLSSKLPNVKTIDANRLQELLKTPALATKADNKAIKTTFALYAMGTAISTYALGILIPKAQYVLRKKLTNNDQFPGDDSYQVKK